MPFIRRLFWRIYLTLLASLVAVAALVGGLLWLLEDPPRDTWGASTIQLSDTLIPARDEPPGTVAGAIRRLGRHMRADIAVYGPNRALIGFSGRTVVPFAGNDGANEYHGPGRLIRLDLPDGRTMFLRMRPPLHRMGLRILMIALVVSVGVALAAFPVTTRLTRRLDRLSSGVARWGMGSLAVRLDDTGGDELAQVARTFNFAAERVEALLRSQKVLLANASHELRSPLSRLRVANEILLQQPSLATHAEIACNLREIDQLVEEILLASRLDHVGSRLPLKDDVDLLGLVVEEATRAGATFAGTRIEIRGDATLLRRLIRNLLDNAVKHGRPPVHVALAQRKDVARIIVSDRGQGIAPEERERVFEPFHRPAGSSEMDGGWGLGLSLVRQIAVGHGGSVVCQEQAGGGNRFVVKLPIAGPASAPITTG